MPNPTDLLSPVDLRAPKGNGGAASLRAFLEKLHLAECNSRYFGLIKGTSRLYELSKELYDFASGGHADQELIEDIERGFNIVARLGYICDESVMPEFNPSAVRLHIAHNCNLACDYCNVDKGHYEGITRSSFMSIDTAKKSIDFLVSSTKRDKLLIIFWGGEPLLNYSLIKWCVDYTRNFGGFEWSFFVQSNGTLIDDEKARYMKQNNFQVAVSLDGPPDIHDKHRVDSGGEGTFSGVKRGLTALHEAGFDQVQLSCVLTRESLGRYREIYDYFKKELPYCVPQLTLEDSIIHGGDVSQAEIEIHSFSRDIETGMNSDYSRNHVYSIIYGFIVAKQDTANTCPQGLEWFTVSPDGDVDLCMHSVMIPEPTFKGGNLNKGLDFSKMLGLTARYGNKCSSCYARSFCAFTGCHLRRFFEYEPPKQFCGTTDALFQKAIEYVASKSYEELVDELVSKSQPHGFNPAMFYILRRSFKHITPFGAYACNNCRSRYFNATRAAS